MKLKCIDNIVREFSTSEYCVILRGYTDSKCLKCGKIFGVHDTKILKPLWKEHICKPEDSK